MILIIPHRQVVCSEEFSHIVIALGIVLRDDLVNNLLNSLARDMMTTRDVVDAAIVALEGFSILLAKQFIGWGKTSTTEFSLLFISSIYKPA